MIIAFMGERKSGKDYFTEHLVNTYGARRLSFSDEVRYLTVQLFPWMPFDFDPAIKDLPFIHEKNPNNLTPRQIWVNVVGKVRDVDPNYFVDSFKVRNLKYIYGSESNKGIQVITDFRTPQEWVFLSNHNIPVIKIDRADRTGIPPDDFEQYVRDFNSYTARFVNRMNGTDEFDSFFTKFVNSLVYV